jgi:archaellum component FlaF (FlaF/FlaG flagellin family)
MGFATLASQVIFIFLFIFVISAYLVLMTQHSTTVQGASETRQSIDLDKLNTRVELNNTKYSGGDVQTDLYNRGSTALETEKFDVYINDARIPRNSVALDYNMQIDTANVDLVDPGDMVRISVTTPLNVGFHRILVTTQHGTSMADTFEVT